MLKLIKKTKSYVSIVLVICLCLGFAACSAPLQKDGILTGEDLLMSVGDVPNTDSEKYSEIMQNQFVLTEKVDSQAFSLKVDTAAYSNIARIIKNSKLPPPDAVRTEELINYFKYDAAVEMSEEHPFGVKTFVAESPFAEGKHMAYIRVKTADIDVSELPPSNLTFLIDTSGSMMSYDKLPLLQQAFSLLVNNLTAKDTISIVTYGGTSQVLLDSADGGDKEQILSVINSLEASGSTAGAKGIQTAYDLAKKNYRADANNRVILATDGDFNVGISTTDALKAFISEKRNEGIYLSVLGFGTGNLRDDIMETLAANGDGNYSYIDNLTTAQKVLVEEMGANMFVVAKDVKANLKFNKDVVKEFRLVGYENRLMSSEDFNNVNKDAGELGAGTDVVVLVELVLHENAIANSTETYNKDLLNVCIRYKTVDNGSQMELNVPVTKGTDDSISREEKSDFNFACSVAAFAEFLRKSEFIGNATTKDIADLATKNLGNDAKGYRIGFVDLINKATTIR